MAKNVATFSGILLIVVGLVGFAVPGFMGMHLSAAHNVVHLVSGALALYFGLRATPAATRTFCIIFGAVYALLGVLGFAAGGADRMLEIVPNQLMLGPTDHIVHIILGAVFLLAGLYRKPVSVSPQGS